MFVKFQLKPEMLQQRGQVGGGGGGAAPVLPPQRRREEGAFLVNKTIQKLPSHLMFCHVANQCKSCSINQSLFIYTR